MPLTCTQFLDKVKTKRTLFALVGKSTQWKVYIDSEVAPLLKSDKVKEDMQLYSGKAEWKSNKLNVLVDGDKEDAKKAFKAAYMGDRLKWEDAGFAIKGSKDDEPPAQGQDAVAAPAQQPTGVRPLDALQEHKLKVLNPHGPQGGVLNVPLALTEAQIAVLLSKLPPGTRANRVNAGAITLDTPVPTTAAHAAPAPQTPARPQQDAPIRPQQQPAKPDVREYQRFKNRINSLMPEIVLVRSSNAALANKAKEAMDLAKTAPAQAQRLLDEMTRELAQAAVNDHWLRLAAQFRLDWERASGGGLITDKGLLAKRKAFEAELSSKKDYKGAVAALLGLQKALENRQKVRNEVMHNWNPLKRRETQLEVIAKNLKLPVEQVGDLVDAALKEMQAETEGLRPEGFQLDEMAKGTGLNIANPKAPTGARPMLTCAEADAVKLYSSGAGGDQAPYKVMNRALWKNEAPAPPHDKAYNDLQAAFAKAKPFPKPVPVTRGLNFDKERMDKFLKPFQDALGTKTLVPLTGFISTSTGGVPKNFEGNLKLNILAKKGLDMAPYSESPWETELLLNHNTMVKVLKIKHKGNSWEVFVEQYEK